MFLSNNTVTYGHYFGILGGGSVRATRALCAGHYAVMAAGGARNAPAQRSPLDPGFDFNDPITSIMALMRPVAPHCEQQTHFFINFYCDQILNLNY